MKDYSNTFRYDDDIKKLIESAEGKNFTQKIECIIRQWAMFGLERYDKELEYKKELVRKESNKLNKIRQLNQSIENQIYKFHREIINL